MRISHKYKFIFLSNPKTGSESMREMLDPYSDVCSTGNYFDKYYHHIHVKRLLEMLKESNINYKDYYIFGFIRNPWDRAVSNYLYCMPDKLFIPFYKEGYDINTKFFYNFNEWIKHHHINNIKPSGLQPLDHFFADDNNIIIPNKIYKLEEIESARENINNKLNIKIKKIIKKNISKNKKHYSLYYNNESYEYVKNLMKFDIKYGNYFYDNKLV